MDSGTIITFYSFKGGVGRSFVLANVAVVLARWGYRVLCVDWDLEAPGLSHYLDANRPSPPGGLLDLIETFDRAGDVDWRGFVTTLNVPDTDGRLALIRAGNEQNDYVNRVQRINWARLYDEKGLGAFLERVRGDWKATYDFVLLDSRTGVTDIGGICTVQLPDILVCALAANQQNVSGILEIAERATRARSGLAFDRAVLLVLPLICRFDGRTEYELAAEWLGKLATALEPLYLNWIHQNVTARQVIDLTIVPYLTIWSFGERLPVLSETGTNPEQVSYRIETIAALLGSSLARTDLLVESRDGYTAAARRAAKHRGRFQYEVFIEGPEDSNELIRGLVKSLDQRGISAYYKTNAVGAQLDALSRSRHFVAVFSQRSGPRETLEQFLKQAIEDRSDRTPIPVLTSGATAEDLPALLRGYRAPILSSSTVESVAAHIQAIVNPEQPQAADVTYVPAPRLTRLQALRSFSVSAVIPATLLFIALIVSWLVGKAAASGIPSTFLRIEWLERWDFGLRDLNVGWGLALLYGSTAIMAAIIYVAAEIVWALPLLDDEHYVPFGVSFLSAALLFALVFGTGPMLIGAVLFGAAFAYLMFKVLD